MRRDGEREEGKGTGRQEMGGERTETYEKNKKKTRVNKEIKIQMIKNKDRI